MPELFPFTLPTVLAAMLLAASLDAPAAVEYPRVAAVNLRGAIARTAEGRQRIAQTEAVQQKRREAVEKEQVELNSLKSRLSQSGSLLRSDAYNDLVRSIQLKTTQVERHTEDAQTDLSDAQRRMSEDIGRPMVQLISSYAQEHGYVLVLDISTPGGTVLWSAKAVDITNQIAQAYDRSHPAATTPKPAAPPTGS